MLACSPLVEAVVRDSIFCGLVGLVVAVLSELQLELPSDFFPDAHEMDKEEEDEAEVDLDLAFVRDLLPVLSCSAPRRWEQLFPKLTFHISGLCSLPAAGADVW